MNEIDRLESAGSDFFKRVREGYLKIADTDNNRVKVLNADQNISKLSNQIWELVCSKLDFKQ